MEYVTVGEESVPALGLGTYRLRGSDCERVVREALELGYRHVDTAEMYGNESAVGRGLRSADVDRDAVFLTTKVWRTNLEYDDVLRSVDQSLDHLGIDAVDLLLVHWPSHTVPIEETLEAFNRIHDEGAARHIGVSNFDLEQLREAMAVSDAPIFADQVRYHPRVDRTALRAFCAEHDLLLTAYSPLGKGSIADDATLGDIGTRYGKTAAQVALRWLIQQDRVAAIPKAASPDHLRENIAVFDFALTADEMATIAEGASPP